MSRPLTDGERQLLTHASRFGSDGYPVHKLQRSRGWTWGTDSVRGAPTVFRTKREAVASFEAFLEVLTEASGAESMRRAVEECLARCGGDVAAARASMTAQGACADAFDHLASLRGAA